ncbi:MAG: hypothetical protein R2716_00440 [Microthrixaceae bacterium]
MVLGEGGATGRNRPVDPGPVEAHHVGVALADDHLVGADDLGLGPVQPVEGLGLVVERVVPRVLVLRTLGVGQLATAEADWPAPLVEDREQHPGPEEVLEPVAAVQHAQTGVLQVLASDTQGPGQLVPAIGGPADAVAGDLLGVEAPRTQVAARTGRVGCVAQPVVIPLDRPLHHLVEVLAALALLPSAALGVAQGDVGLASEVLDRVHEVQVLDRGRT